MSSAAANPAPPAPTETVTDTADEAPTQPIGDRFRQERVDRDDILRRAVLERVRQCFADVDYATPSLPGFDLALVPRSRTAVFRRGGIPSLLVRLADKIDAALVIDAWTSALRARIPEKPVVLLLLGPEVDRRAFAEVVDDRRKKHPNVAESIIPVALDMRDWNADIPAHAPDSVCAAVGRLRNFTS